MGINQISPQHTQQTLARIDTDFNGRVTKQQLFQAFRNIYISEGLYKNSQQINQISSYNSNYNEALSLWLQNGQNGSTQPNFTQAQQQFANNYVQSNNFNHTNNFNQSQHYQNTPNMNIGQQFTMNQNFSGYAPNINQAMRLQL